MREGASVGLVILGGGAATRCPGKLERPIGDLPMLVRTCRNLGGRYPTYICLSADSDSAARLRLNAEILVDREPLRGPLRALVDAFGAVREPRAFVVAGDMPLVQAGALSELIEHWESGDQAVVALDEDGRLQPLLAIYDRAAFLRAATSHDAERDGVKDVLSSLRWRGIALPDPATLANVNTEEQYRAALREFAGAAIPRSA